MPLLAFAALFADLTGERQAPAPVASRCHEAIGWAAEATPLREHEPHLSGCVSPGLQLDKYLRKDRRLRIDKTLQIKRFGSGSSRPRGFV